MPPRPPDLVGQRFGRLMVQVAVKQSGKTAWRCRCDCGGHKITQTASLRTGHTQSCGCIHREMMVARKTTHGMTSVPEYNAWSMMKRRCYDPNTNRWELYGARGITVCDRWRYDFAAFYADMGPRPKGCSLDRINNDGNYEPGNVRWATPTQQSNNRRPRRTVLTRGEDGRWQRTP